MFKKIILIYLFSLMLVEAKDAFSSERFLGIEVGYTSADATNILPKKVATKDIEYGIRLGAQNDEWRTTVALNVYGDNEKQYKRAMLEFDRFVWSSLYKTDDIVFKPYLGGHIGYIKYTDDNGEIEDSGLVYGAQGGIAWNVLDEVDFDLSYRYSVTGLSFLDNIGSFVFGANYIY